MEPALSRLVCQMGPIRDRVRSKGGGGAGEHAERREAPRVEEGQNQGGTSGTLSRRYVELTPRKRLREWFKNENRALGKGGQNKIIPLSDIKPKRKLQRRFGYSHLYYESKLKAIIEPGYLEYLKSLPDGEEPKPMCAYRNEQLTHLLSLEPREVQDEVDLYCLRTSPTADDEEETSADMDSGGRDSRTPEQADEDVDGAAQNRASANDNPVASDTGTRKLSKSAAKRIKQKGPSTPAEWQA